MASKNSLTESSGSILIVDDSSLVRLYCRTVLERDGYEVEEAINGMEGLERLLDRHFDLIILDVNMPGMDGFSFLRALRRSSSNAADTPVMVMTTEAKHEDREDARSAGANLYVVKPIGEPDLIRYAALMTGAMK